MKIHQLDDDYVKKRRKNWPAAFRFSFQFLCVIWVVFIIDTLTFSNLSYFGLKPRQLEGLIGIISSPFLHANLAHLASNTLPLLLACTALFGNYPKISKRVFIFSFLLTGVVVWIFARSANHIGASGILYALLSFLFFSGFFKKDMQSAGISLAIAFMYGSMIFGVLPQDESISWESHLFGMISGLLLAFYYRKTDMPVYKSWNFEEDEDFDY